MIRMVTDLSKDGANAEIFIAGTSVTISIIENELKEFADKIEKATGTQLVLIADKKKLVYGGSHKAECLHIQSFCDPIDSSDKKQYVKKWTDGFYTLLHFILEKHQNVPMAILRQPNGTLMSVKYGDK